MNGLHARFSNKLPIKSWRLADDFTPILSVLFLILSYIISSSDLAPVPGVVIRIPEVDNVTFYGGANLMPIVVVDRQGRLFFRHQLMEEDMLLINLRRLSPIVSSHAPLIIKADSSINLGSLTRIYNICIRSGISNLALEVSSP